MVQNQEGAAVKDSEEEARWQTLWDAREALLGTEISATRGVIQMSGNCTVNSLLLCMFPDPKDKKIQNMFKAFFENQSGAEIRQKMAKIAA